MLATGDLFEVANSLADLIDAPVTIEDRDTIVMAYSGRGQAVDEARIETILGRQVPVRLREAIREAGVFEQLERSDDVIVVDLPEVGLRPRAVVAVRDRGVLVGSIWAAIGARPTDAQRMALRTAAPVVAEHLRRERVRADQLSRERSDLVAALLAGGEAAEEAAEHLGAGPWLVMAMRGREDDLSPDVWGALALHLAAVAPSAVCAPIGPTAYAVLGVAARDLIADFMTRFRLSEEVVVGFGTTTSRAADLGTSRLVADQVAESLLRRGRLGEVADLEATFSDVLVDRLSPFLATHADVGPLRRLEEHDAAHHTGLVEAVRAFLESDHPGDIAATAEVLHVHPNTIRNRLRRARECGVDLSDPDTRLALMITLRRR